MEWQFLVDAGEVTLWDPIASQRLWSIQAGATALTVDDDRWLHVNNERIDLALRTRTGGSRVTPRPGQRASPNHVLGPDAKVYCSGEQHTFGSISLSGRPGGTAVIDGAWWSAAISPDGRLLALGGNDGKLEIRDTDTLEVIRELQGHTSNVYCVEFHPDGSRLATGGNDNRILLWDTTDWQPMLELRGHHSYVKALRFSPDGTQLASVSGDFSVRLWDTCSRAERHRQARAAEAVRERLRPRVVTMLSELGDKARVAEAIVHDLRWTPSERAAARRVLGEL